MKQAEAAIKIFMLALGAMLSACGAGSRSIGTQSASCASEEQRTLTERQQVRGPGFLELELSSSDHRGPAPAYIKLTLRNGSNDLLWVNYRMATGPGGDVSLRAVDAHGGAIEQTECFGKMVPPNATDYMALAPFGEVSQIRPLSCFPLEHPGRWTVTAEYRAEQSPRAPPPTNAKWFAGVASSNSIVVNMNSEPPPR